MLTDALMEGPSARLRSRVEPVTRFDNAESPTPLQQALSGSWFEPATSGQGVLMELMPPQPSGNGVLTAGWFTYDPEGADNDERSQHWFLLNGPLVAGSAGRW